MQEVVTYIFFSLLGATKKLLVTASLWKDCTELIKYATATSPQKGKKSLSSHIREAVKIS
jgi:hypothetical protein